MDTVKTKGQKILDAALKENGSVTVSEATLKTGDLLTKFYEFLEGLTTPERPEILAIIDRRANDGATVNGRCLKWEAYLETETAAEDLGELSQALDEVAPEGFYFGAHCGDGASFGFYPNDDDE